MIDTRIEGKTSTESPRIWDRLELRFEKRDKVGLYATRVQDVTADEIIVDRPAWLSGEALFEVGAEFIATFVRPDAAYQFAGKVLARTQPRPQQYSLAAPKRVQRQQRRQFYRLSCDFAARLKTLESLRGADDLESAGAALSRCLNLSGNGAFIETELSCKLGDYLLMEIELPGDQADLAVIGTVRRIEPGDEDTVCCGIKILLADEARTLLGKATFDRRPEQYKNYDEEQRIRLANFIFAEQLAQRRKSLI
jgi:c-di-GMP-binding flagellar brake protein YcgR